MATIDMDVRKRSLERAMDVRFARAALRQDLRADRITLAELLLDPPPALKTMLLADVLRLNRTALQSWSGLAVIGRQAVRDDVNLMLRCDRASADTRAWVAEHGLFGARCGRGDAPRAMPRGRWRDGRDRPSAR